MKNNYVKKVLPNGIKVYFYKDKNAKRTFVSYNVKYGTFGYFDKFIYNKKISHVAPAMAHFLEHTLIEHSKYGNMMHRFMDKNYDSNGLTYPEVTSYYFLGIEDIDTSIEELINMVDSPAFTRENVDEVKSAVIEELKKDSDDKYRRAFSCNRRNVFSNFEACLPNYNILGTVKSTENITYEEVKTAYDAYYHDENKFLVIGGNININHIMKLLTDIYSKITPHPNLLEEYSYEQNFQVRTNLETLKMPTDANFVIHTIKIKKPNISNMEIDLFLSIFNKLAFDGARDEIDEMLHQKIAINGIGTSVDIFKDSIAISYYTDTYYPEKFINNVHDILKNFKPTQKDLDLVIKSLVVSEISKMDNLYKTFMQFPLGIEFTENIDDIDTIKRVKLDDLEKARHYIVFDNTTTTIIENKK